MGKGPQLKAEQEIQFTFRSLKTPLQTVSPKWVCQVGWKLNKNSKAINTPPKSPTPRTGSPSYPTWVNCGTHQSGAATKVDSAEPRLVQNTVSINCGG